MSQYRHNLTLLDKFNQKKQSKKQVIPSISTFLSSNKSAVSIQQFNSIAKYKNQSQISNESLLNDSQSEMFKNTLKSFSAVINSEKQILTSRRKSVTKRKTQNYVSQRNSLTNINPQAKMTKIRQQRIKKNKQLQDIQSRISLLSASSTKTIRPSTSQRLQSYSHLVQQFSSFLQSCQQISQLRSKWQQLLHMI